MKKVLATTYYCTDAKSVAIQHEHYIFPKAWTSTLHFSQEVKDHCHERHAQCCSQTNNASYYCCQQVSPQNFYIIYVQ